MPAIYNVLVYVQLPVLTYLCIAALCFFNTALMKTRLGHTDHRVAEQLFTSQRRNDEEGVEQDNADNRLFIGGRRVCRCAPSAVFGGIFMSDRLLAALRAQMKSCGVDAYIAPHSDLFPCEVAVEEPRLPAE